MARLDDIRSEIKAAFMASPELQAAYGFDPAKSFDEQFSELSLEASDINLFAAVQDIAEGIINADRNEIQAIIDSGHIGTGPWLVQLVKQFQWNPDVTYYLVVDPVTGQIHYNRVVPEDRIITQAAWQESEGEVRIKVATGEPGNLHPITLLQELALNNYIQSLKIAGVKVVIVNAPADILELKAAVYYDRAYSNSNLLQDVIDALNHYSVELNFNGVVYRTAVVDAVKRIPGVKDMYIPAGGLIGVQGPTRTDIVRDYTTFSGYFNFKSDDGFPELTLIAE